MLLEGTEKQMFYLVLLQSDALVRYLLIFQLSRALSQLRLGVRKSHRNP